MRTVAPKYKVEVVRSGSLPIMTLYSGAYPIEEGSFLKVTLAEGGKVIGVGLNSILYFSVEQLVAK